MHEYCDLPSEEHNTTCGSGAVRVLTEIRDMAGMRFGVVGIGDTLKIERITWFRQKSLRC